MAFLYILLSITIIIFAFRLFARNALSFEFFLFWVFVGTALFFTVIFPDAFGYIRSFFYYGNRKGNFVFIISITTLFMLFMRLTVILRETKKKQEKLAQKLALTNFRLENTSAKPVKNKILIKMAAYNESKNIGAVLDQMPDDVDVLVIDDGSTDDTVRIALEYGAMVIKHPVNLGQGAADITGFRFAIEEGYHYVIEMDADGQHNPVDIPLFIQKLDEMDADIITGSRVLGSTHSDNSALRNFFLPLYTKLLNRLTSYKLTDSMCGFKAYRMSRVRNDRDIFDEVTESQYLASELYIRFSHRGYKVKEIPIHIGRRETGMSRKGTFRYGLRVLRIMLRVWLIEKLVLKPYKFNIPK